MMQQNGPQYNNEKRNTSKLKSLLQGIVISLLSLFLFFGVLEGGLYLFGVEPVSVSQDPFVGFSGNVPLFEEYKRAPNGNLILKTAQNKMTLFNKQVFVEQKAADTYRIFCLGGSTTYGRPYNDTTSFSAWLRELLPETQKSRDWEVLNVGGISYASYRVARLMEELIQYEPDLFIVYTGQNEFLEERTYRDFLQIPELVRSNIDLLAKTRTWAAMTTMLEKLNLVEDRQKPTKPQLAAEVDAMLDHSTGPEEYQRDDELSQEILEHYRVSLERMVAIAQKAGAEIIFVTPASNLKDFSPFKSEHTAGLDKKKQGWVEGLLSAAQLSLRENEPSQALELLDEAVVVDPRYARLHYLRGKALFSLGRYDDAYKSFWRALDEDVCPLRALSPMPGIVKDVAANHRLPLVDFAAMVENIMLDNYGHRIPGEELFLDHVHPTVDGHKWLAVSLLEKMTSLGIVKPDAGWHKQRAIAVATQNIESRINVALQGWSLINLAKVLHWAGKFDDAERSARRALEMGQRAPVLVAPATDMLIKLGKLKHEEEKIDSYIATALDTDPWNPLMHYRLGVSLLQQEASAKGAAHILLATAFDDTNKTNSVLGLLLYNRGHYELAYPVLKKSVELKMDDYVSQEALKSLSKKLVSTANRLPMPKIVVQGAGASARPERIFMQSTSPAGEKLLDGLFTEWHENGRPKNFAEFKNGVRHGQDITWSPDGKMLSRRVFVNGELTEKTDSN